MKMPRDREQTPDSQADSREQAAGEEEQVEAYEPPTLTRFEKLEKLIVSGE